MCSYISIGMGSFLCQMSIIPDLCTWSWVCGSLLPNLINVVTPVLPSRNGVWVLHNCKVIARWAWWETRISTPCLWGWNLKCQYSSPKVLYIRRQCKRLVFLHKEGSKKSAVRCPALPTEDHTVSLSGFFDHPNIVAPGLDSARLATAQFYMLGFLGLWWLVEVMFVVSP